jgi:hypothetical protein
LLSSQEESSPRPEAAEESVLVRIAGHVVEALCAEPAIAAFQQAFGKRVCMTVCSSAADLYVGHPAVRAIMYHSRQVPDGLFDRVIDLEAGTLEPLRRVRRYAEQMAVELSDMRPRIYVTSMDRLRTGRFKVTERDRLCTVILLPEQTTSLEQMDTLAADIEERLGAGVVFVSLSKYPALEHGKNLTGRLMPREIAAVLRDADLWIGMNAEAAVLGWAAGSGGIVFTDEPFDSPDETIVIRPQVSGREALLEAVSELFEKNDQTI